MVSISRKGLTLPSTWMTLGSSKHLTTWTMASTSWMLLKNWFPVLTLEAPLYQACGYLQIQSQQGSLSWNDTSLPALLICHPELLPRPHWGRWFTERIVSGFRSRLGQELKSVLFPTLGRPTIPSFMIYLPFRPNDRVCLSCIFYSLFHS